MNTPTMTRPVLRYPGAKFKYAQLILSFFPSHDTFVDVFGGGANISLAKELTLVNVYNDIDDEVVNFFQVLRSSKDELIKSLRLTPYSRTENKLAFEYSDDPIESARRFYIRLWQGYGHSLSGANSGWRFITRKGHDVVGNWNDLDRLGIAAEKLKQYQIECDSYDRILTRYDNENTLFFLDPPYILDTRKEKSLYNHEMSDQDHAEMVEKCLCLQGKVILCGYEHEIYKPLLEHKWSVFTYKAHANGGHLRTEALYLSPNCSSPKTLFDWNY